VHNVNTQAESEANWMDRLFAAGDAICNNVVVVLFISHFLISCTSWFEGMAMCPSARLSESIRAGIKLGRRLDVILSLSHRTVAAVVV